MPRMAILFYYVYMLRRFRLPLPREGYYTLPHTLLMLSLLPRHTRRHIRHANAAALFATPCI